MINKIHNENCLQTMAKMPDNFIDATITSPPYDNLREYNGYKFDFKLKAHIEALSENQKIMEF